jgi:hypothetical protein
MKAAIGKLLTQFEANGGAKPPEKPWLPEPVAKPAEIRREPQPQPPSPPPKAEAPPVGLLDDAYRRGYAAGLAGGDAKLEERAKWSDQQAVAIVNGFTAACREIETNVASSVARILRSFLVDAVRDKAVAALVEQISALTSNSPVPVFRITGPSDLLGRVRAQLDTARRTGIEYEVADTFEIRVVADQTVIETQISVWTECLKDVRR